MCLYVFQWKYRDNYVEDIKGSNSVATGHMRMLRERTRQPKAGTSDRRIEVQVGMKEAYLMFHALKVRNRIIKPAC